MNKINFFCVLVMALLLTTACATAHKASLIETPAAATHHMRQATLTVEQERHMTEEVLPEIKKDFPPLEDTALQEYVAKVGARITAANKLDGNPYKYNYTVVSGEAPRAFSLPAGEIFVTTGLLAQATCEMDLATALAHEVAHVKARHASERISALQRTNKPWYAVGGGWIGGAMGYGIGKMADEDSLAQKYSFFPHTPDEDLEADELGSQMLLTAGYDKKQVASNEFLKNRKKAQALVKSRVKG